MNLSLAGSRPLGAAKARYLLISLAILLLDQWSKLAIERTLPEYASREVIPGFFQLTHVRNTGVAFGMFASHGDLGVWVLIGIGFAALAAVGLYFRRAAANEPLLLVALALVLGGAVGNLVDRVFTGAVTDFFDVFVGSYHWHIFNVADSAISVALGLLLLDALRPKRQPAAAP
jgi:signal peptidase II